MAWRCEDKRVFGGYANGDSYEQPYWHSVCLLSTRVEIHDTDFTVDSRGESK
jgi:hypothetical protein